MANWIQLDDRIYNYFALYVCIMLEVHPDNVFKAMGVAPPPAQPKTRKYNYAKMARAYYLFRHLCGESANEIGARFDVTSTYVFMLIKKGREELINDSIGKTDYDS